MLTAIQAYVMKQLQNGTPVNSTLIQMLVDDFAPIASHKKKLHDRYTIKDLPILKRKMPEGNKINNKVNNDFVGEIIDTKIGYVLGESIKYNVDKNMYAGMEAKHKDHQAQVNKFIIRNQMNDKDIELGKLVSICGVAGREIYIDKRGNEKVANLMPWQTIFLTDAEDNVEYAVRLYSEMRLIDNKLVELSCAEFFDERKISYFVEMKSQGDDSAKWVVDAEKPVRPHVFGMTPIVKVKNNDEEMGDIEKVLAAIDAYDRTVSDVNSEIEQFRLAYMKFVGVTVTPELVEQAKQTGGFQVPADGDVSFITKQINDLVVENHLKRLERDINRFGKHVNMSDPSFGGGDSAPANAFKLNSLEMKSAILEVKMKTAFLRQFEIVSNAWAKKGIVVDYLNIFFEFSRNLPANILAESDTTIKLKGLVSERTRLAQLSFVDDVEYELEQMTKDKENDLETLQPEPTTEERFNLGGTDLDGEETE